MSTKPKEGGEEVKGRAAASTCGGYSALPLCEGGEELSRHLVSLAREPHRHPHQHQSPHPIRREASTRRESSGVRSRTYQNDRGWKARSSTGVSLT